MFVREWMSAPAHGIGPDKAAQEAVGVMERHKVRRLPVVKDGGLVGIVTKSDLVAELGRRWTPAREMNWQVSDIMTRNPRTVAPDDTLETAAQLMLENKISGLPVVEDDKVVGILTESDLFRALCEMMGIGEKGARIVMTLKDGEDVLGSIRRRLNGLVMRSLVTVHDPKHGRWNVVLRVRGRVPARSTVS